MTLINFFFLEKKVGISWSVDIVFDTLRVFHCKIDNKLQMPLSLKYDIFYWLINKLYKMRLKGKLTLKCCILEKNTFIKWTLMVSFSSSLHAWRADEFWGHCPEYHEFFQDDHAIPYHDLLSAVWCGVSCSSWCCKSIQTHF